MNEWFDQNTITEYSKKAVDRVWGWYEYEVNFPDLIRLLPTKRESLLDFGCGPGEFTSLLTQEADQVTGADVAPMIAVAKDKYPEVRFIAWDGGDPVSDELEKYDVVFAKLSLQFVEDLESVVRQFYKITETNGHLVVSVPNPDKISKQFGLIGAENKRYVDEIGNTGIKIYPIHRTKTEYLRVFKKAGFEVIEISEPVIPKELCYKYQTKNGEYSSRFNLKLRRSH